MLAVASASGMEYRASSFPLSASVTIATESSPPQRSAATVTEAPFHPDEVSEPAQRPKARIMPVGPDGGDGVNGHPVVRHADGELVNGHVLQHALAVPLEALRQGLLGAGVVVVVQEGDVCPAVVLFDELPRLGQVARDVLVEAHVNGDVPARGEVPHELQLGDGGRPRLRLLLDDDR